jgi:hypothetical protein
LAINIGDAVNGRIVYDTSVPASSLFAGGAEYPQPNTFNVVVDGHTFSSTGLYNLFILHLGLGGQVDRFQAQAGTLVAPGGGVTLAGAPVTASMEFELEDITHSAFSGVQLPTSLNLASFNLRVGNVIDRSDPLNVSEFSYSVDNITLGPLPSVPEPATLTLLGMGIAFMGGYTWRKRKRAVAR